MVVTLVVVDGVGGDEVEEVGGSGDEVLFDGAGGLGEPEVVGVEDTACTTWINAVPLQPPSGVSMDAETAASPGAMPSTNPLLSTTAMRSGYVLQWKADAGSSQ